MVSRNFLNQKRLWECRFNWKAVQVSVTWAAFFEFGGCGGILLEQLRCILEEVRWIFEDLSGILEKLTLLLEET